MELAAVTVHFKPVSLAARIRRGRSKLVLGAVLLAASPGIVAGVGALIGGGGTSFERTINWAIIGFPIVAIAIAMVVPVLTPGEPCTVSFSERGIHGHDRVHPWIFIREALEDGNGLELRCGYGIGSSATAAIPETLLLPRAAPEYERVRGLVAAQAGARLRMRTTT